MLPSTVSLANGVRGCALKDLGLVIVHIPHSKMRDMAVFIFLGVFVVGRFREDNPSPSVRDLN